MAGKRSSRDRSRQQRWRTRAGIVAAGALVVPTALLAGGAGAQSDPGSDPAQVGSFSDTFVEPTISDFTGHPRVTTDERCIERPAGEGTQQGETRGFIDCKPAAGGLVQLENGKNLYYDNLAGTENVEVSILSEYGVVGLNDQSRVVDPNARTWEEPTPADAGAKSEANIAPIIPGELFRTTEDENDGSLFCADVNFLPDGRVLAVGGTKYVNDPGNDASKFGSTELLGIENARIFDPETNRWTQTGSMNKPRWYPTATTLGNGDQFVASGLRRLVKAVNTQDPINPNSTAPGFGLQEGQNERVTETFKVEDGSFQFEEGPDSARRSLPLFPRMHLLPNGNVFYNAAGQAFNPLGQAFDQALWNIAATYNPGNKTWTDLGIPGVGVSPVPGFRGSTFSVMLPLVPGEGDDYSRASFLTGGGVTGAVVANSPGGYTAIRDSYISNIETAGGTEVMTPEDTGDMTATTTPATGRWYGSGTLLPTGEVLATAGADKDEVAVPGFEIPVQHAELYDPETKTWRRLADQNKPRTYHNTANLMQDGRVLIGGHATISNAYLSNRTLPGGVTAPNDGRDPTLEIYSPPYLSCPGEQTQITSQRPEGDELELDLSVPASEIESVVAVRNATQTHVVDADQRNVELKVLSREGNTIRVEQAPNGNVLPPGPYMVFVNRNVGGCIKPGVSAQMRSAANGKLEPSATDSCLGRRARIGVRNVGRVVLNRSRRTTLRRPVAQPEDRTPRTYTWCVDGNAGKVKAVFDRKGSRARMSLVGTTAGVHRHRGLRPAANAASSRLRQAFPRRLTVVHGGKGKLRIFRATAQRSRRVIGVRGDRVAFLGVADRSMLRKGNRDRLRRSVRLAGF